MKNIRVPFNDLSRIHSELAQEFQEAVGQSLKVSEFVLGSAVAEFEEHYAQSEGFGYCVGVDNGTNAIELALRAVGVTSQHEVIIPAITFVATAFAVQRIGAIPILVDTLADSPHLDASRIEDAISSRTKAIIYVSLHGSASNLISVAKVANSHGLDLIIDGAQSHGLRVSNQPLSSYCTVMTTSFYPGKNLGSLGEGGAVLSNNQAIDKRVRLMRDWGAESKYQHTYWGGNFRLHSLQARFLDIKLKYLPEWTKNRKDIASKYDSLLDSSIVRKGVDRNEHVFHIYEIKALEREKFIAHLNSRGIQHGIHYPRVISENKAFSQLLPPWPISNACSFAKSTLSIPLFPRMFEWEINEVLHSVNTFLRND